MKKHKISIIDYLTVILLLGVSGFQIIRNSLSDDVSLKLVFIILLVLLLFYGKAIKNIRFVVFVLIYVGLIIIHWFYFDYFKYETLFGYVIRIFIAYIAVSLLNKNYLESFVDVLYIVALISVVLLFMSEIKLISDVFLRKIGLVLQIKDIYVKNDNKAIIFNRNSGPFWEPGAFGGYLIIALLFNLFYLKDYFYGWKNFVLILAILSTQSTSAYLALIFLIFFYYETNCDFSAVKKVSIFALFALGLFFVLRIPFIGEKIIDQYDLAVLYIGGYNIRWDSQRFISTYSDIMTFINNPLFGAGLSNYTRFYLQGYRESSIMTTNGWADMLARWGITGFLLYFYSMYYSFKKMTIIYGVNRSVSGIMMFIIFLLGSSEGYFYMPFFWSLAIYGLFHISYENNSANTIKGVSI